MRRTQDRPLPSGRLTPEAVLIIGGAVRRAGTDLSGAGGQSAHGVLGAVTLGQLSLYLHAAQARDHAEHRHRRDSRRASAVDGLDGGARRNFQRRLVAVCHSLFLAIAAFPGHCLDVSGTNTPRPVSSCCRWWIQTRRADGPPGACATRWACCRSACVRSFSTWSGPVYLGGALILGVAFLWCAFQFSRQLTLPRARRLFFASIIYLAVITGANGY